MAVAAVAVGTAAIGMAAEATGMADMAVAGIIAAAASGRA